VLIATGVYYAVFFHHPFVWMTLAAPAVVGGLALCLIGGGRVGAQAKTGPVPD
jgi:hypothetical protein